MSVGSHWSPVGRNRGRGREGAAGEWVITEAAPPSAEKLNVRSHRPTCRTDLGDGHQKTPLGLIPRIKQEKLLHY